MKTRLLSLIFIAFLAFAVSARAQFFPDQFFSATCTAACTTAVISTQGMGTVSIQATGTGTGLAFTFQGTIDGGVTWQTIGGVAPSTQTLVASASANGIWLIPSAGFSQVRVNLSAISGGSETFTLESSQRFGGLPGGAVVLQPNNVFSANTQGTSTTLPVPWATQLHQNQGVCSAHQPAWEDCNNNVTADEMILQTPDPSTLYEVGFGGGNTNGDQLGLQLTVAGTTYNEYVTYTTGESNTALAQDLAARINGGLRGGTVASAGTGIVNGQKYTLAVPVGIGTNPATGQPYTCAVVPTIIATASLGALTGFTVTGSGGSNIQGGICSQPLPSPVGLNGANATITPTQGDYTYVAALATNYDVNGVGDLPTANILGTTVVAFDFPWGASNTVKVCAGVTTNMAPGVSCPGSPTGTLSGVVGLGLGFDVNPHFTFGRAISGRHPHPQDKIALLDFAGQSGATTGLNTGFGAVTEEIGPSWAAVSQSTVAAGNSTLTLDALNAPSVSNGWYVYDKNNPAAIPDGTTVASGGGTTSIVLSNNLVNQGVVTGDQIYFVNEAAPCGETSLYAANPNSALNFAGTFMEVSGCVADSSGYDVEVSKAGAANLLLGVRNPNSGAFYAGWQLATGTSFSTATAEMQDNSGTPTFVQIYGTPVVSATNELTTATNGGSFFWKNTTTTWATLTGSDLTLGSGVGLLASGLATSGTIAGSICATSAGLILYESGASSCTISLEELKHDIAPIGDTSDLMALKPISFGFDDPTQPQHRYGFGARQVASVDPALSTVDGKGDLQAYDPNGILALTVAVVQRQQWEIRGLMAAVALLALWCAGLTVVATRKR